MDILKLKDNGLEIIEYDYADYPAYIRRDRLSLWPNYCAPGHWHDDIELIAVLSGEMQYNVNGRVLSLSEGEGIVVNARQMHFGFSGKKRECCFLCVLLHPLLLCATSGFERDFVLPLLDHRERPCWKLHRDTEWQKEIFRDIEQIYAAREEKAAPLKIQNLFVRIWSLLYENTPLKQGKETQNADLTILKKMIGFIQRHYAEKISLSDIAAAGFVGQSKCCKLFSGYLGQTPNFYLTQYRLEKSMELLIHTDLTAGEIAMRTGFGGSSYYAETFRRFVNMSPTEYRKNNRFPP